MERDIIQEILESGCKVSMGINSTHSIMVIDIVRGANKTQYMLNANCENTVDIMKECIRAGIKKNEEYSFVEQMRM